jgi:hypothetical protein
MYNESQAQLKHLTALKSKYQATSYQDSSPSSLLYFILRKVECCIEINELELNWLRERKLFKTIEAIQHEQQHREAELLKLGIEFCHLKSKYKATSYCISWKSSPLYFILKKLDSGNKLNDSDFEWLKAHGLSATMASVELREREIQRFINLKAKYKATQYQDSSPDSPLYQILKRLEAEERLSDSDVNWLKEEQLFETLAFFQHQEALREASFSQLKDKYQVTRYLDTSASSPLYLILQQVDSEELLNESEINWLQQQGLTEIIAFDRELQAKRNFAALKAKYKATHYEDSSPYNHLYTLLKRVESGIALSEPDTNFLKKRKLTETIVIAQDKYVATLKYKIESGEQLSESETEWLKQNGREEIIVFAQKKDFATLKLKYDVSDYKDKSPSNPLYAILQKLEKGERLEPTDVGWLEENKIEGYKLFSGKILIAHHKIEATFYEQEYNRTENKWNLPNASSHWRKAGEPRRALKLTANLDLDRIKETKLKSALLTTRGGAFRDISKLDDAEYCARQAIKYQPNSHHPYTLMGAICYERHQYADGDYWFNEAIKRGANPRDTDAEIKRVVRNAKDENKRREVVEYLLKKDPVRYAWAKFYQKKLKNKS